MLKKHTSIKLVALILWAVTNTAAALTCTSESTVLCITNECHTPTEPRRTWTVISETELSRCDATGCDKFPATITKAGAFTNATTTNPSYMLKFDQNMKFVEVTAMGLVLMLQRGTCK